MYLSCQHDISQSKHARHQAAASSGRHYLFFSYSIYHWLKIVIVVGCLAFYSVVIMGILLQSEEMDNIFNVSLARKDLLLGSSLRNV